MDNLGKATINLKIYFWLDGNKHSWMKVRSSAIRLIRKAFQENNISMPVSEQEIIFPRGICINFAKEDDLVKDKASFSTELPETITTDAEAKLESEAKEIEKQAKHSRNPEHGENLLKNKNNNDSG